MVTFQRARSDQQRAARRQTILGAATAMLAEMPVADISLNELARRTGLAKSNVLRYFESREAVLLELLDHALAGWLDGLGAELRDAVVPGAPVADRIDGVAATIAETLAAQPVLCDLIGAQAAVLEHNVSAQVAARYKRATIEKAIALGTLVSSVVPELAPDALVFGGAVTLTAGAIWAHANPSAAMLQAYASDPALGALRLDFARTMTELLAVLATGLTTRRADGRGEPVLLPEISA